MSVSEPTPLPSRVRAHVDFDATGKRFGYLTVPHSRDESAWGSIRLPIVSIRGGDGPTVVFTAGNHGDEYEGQIALLKLARELDPARVAGQVIIVPSLNLPAVDAGTRLSPVDGLNMNRVFPGRRDGTVTLMIADFIYREVLTRADVVVDIHSGGKTLDFVPCAVMHELADKDIQRRTVDALMAFAAPVGLVLVELDSQGTLDTAVEQMGTLFLSTELGGGGSVTAETMRIADTGVRNVLSHFGVIEGRPVRREDLGYAATRLMNTPDDGFVGAAEGGMHEVLVDLGEEVEAGQPIGRVHDYHNPDREPSVYHAPCSGMLICRHYPGLVRSGDCLAVIATDYRPA